MDFWHVVNRISFVFGLLKEVFGGGGGGVGEGYVFMPNSYRERRIGQQPMMDGSWKVVPSQFCACEASPHSRTIFADFNFPNCPTSW
jgi:hypothetical protein